MPQLSRTTANAGSTASGSPPRSLSPPSTSWSADASPRNSRCSGRSRAPTGSCRPEPKLSTAHCATCSTLGIRPWLSTTTRSQLSPLRPEHLPSFDMLPLTPARTSTRDRYAMNEDSSIIRLRQPEAIDDPLTALLRSGARRLLEQAIEAEVEAFLASRKDLKLADGRDRLVRHGPERVIQTGIGPVELQRVKVRDRAPGPASERIRFSSALLPRWARRTTSLDALLPILYLRGVSPAVLNAAESQLHLETVLAVR